MTTEIISFMLVGLAECQGIWEKETGRLNIRYCWRHAAEDCLLGYFLTSETRIPLEGTYANI